MHKCKCSSKCEAVVMTDSKKYARGHAPASHIFTEERKQNISKGRQRYTKHNKNFWEDYLSWKTKPGEEWRDVKDFEGDYLVSSFGRVYSVRTSTIRKLTRFKGYRTVNLCVDYTQKQFLVHVLVARAFLGKCPKGKEVNHKDLDKANNYYKNLEYVTSKENKEHAVRHGVVFGDGGIAGREKLQELRAAGKLKYKKRILT